MSKMGIQVLNLKDVWEILYINIDLSDNVFILFLLPCCPTNHQNTSFSYREGILKLNFYRHNTAFSYCCIQIKKTPETLWNGNHISLFFLPRQRALFTIDLMYLINTLVIGSRKATSQEKRCRSKMNLNERHFWKISEPHYILKY